jgi:hypothetical protein
MLTRGASSHAPQPRAQACMQRSYGSEAQARMLLNSGRKLASLSAMGVGLHGPCGMVTDQRRKIACFLNSGRKLACFPGRGARLHATWLRIRARKLACVYTRGASSHVCQKGGASLQGPRSIVTD